MKSRYIFVYGTLKRKFANPLTHTIQKNATFVGEGSIPGTLFRLDWYPGAVYEPTQQNQVFGEIFEVHNPGLFEELDEYEGVTGAEHDEYEKIIVSVSCEGRSYSCWFYQYRGVIPRDKVLPDGRF